MNSLIASTVILVCGLCMGLTSGFSGLLVSLSLHDLIRKES